jgi:uncharacterized protein (DUF1684 family)
MVLFNKEFKSGVFITLLTFSFLTGFAQGENESISEINAHRKEQEKEFRDKQKSPLTPKLRSKFKHLNYYPIDLKYRVIARFVKTENPVLFKMKTSTDRLPVYSKYADVYFTIDSIEHKLEVYRSGDISRMAGYEDYLFIPFTDLTNGEETYEAGRYIDMRIPEGEQVIIDFNQCYNPYCSYGAGRYSCPIPPEPNRLAVAIPAGEKKYLNH